MKFTLFAAAAALLVVSARGAAAAPETPAVAPIAADPVAMDYRPLLASARSKSGASLKPEFDNVVPQPITVELRAHRHADGSMVIECDGGSGHLPAPAATSEPQS